ncbi:MAG: prenyltransferase [Candidatus Aminicenantes bacterium]|nr:prenyltransferase [Candidatus Aminicenantes bacterium]
MTDSARVPALRVWIVAGRPWSFPASTMPVLFGTSLAVAAGGAPFRPLRFLLAMTAMVVLHAASNTLSDAFDFQRGLDRETTPLSGAVVRGWLRPNQAVCGAAVLFAAGVALGLVLTLMSSPLLLVVGGAGVLIGAAYSLLKRCALGDLAVFLNFGILGALGAWLVQAGSLSLIPALWTAPMAMLVAAILHANNWRDAASDRALGVRSLAAVLGDRGSLVYYGFLLFGPFAVVVALMLVPRAAGGTLPALPWTFLLVFAALPRAVSLFGRGLRRRTPRRPMDFAMLDGATARYNLVFGLLSTAAVWLDLLARRL